VTAGQRFWHSLSARLLLLTTGFVMQSEVLIYLPSAARFRESYFEAKLEAAWLATRAVIAAPDEMVSRELADELLRSVGAHAIVLRRKDARALMLESNMPPHVDMDYDMMAMAPLTMIADTLRVIGGHGERLVRVMGMPRGRTDVLEIVVDEAPLREALLAFSWRILGLSLAISLFTAGLVFLSLRWLMVAPLRRLTAGMMAFRAAPEDVSRAIVPGRRRDEIGIAEAELAAMQSELRAALHQKTRLAALGLAVSKISHDLRGILATGQLVSDRLAESADPDVRRLAPRLVATLDRAIALCASTLKYGRADEPPPVLAPVALLPLAEEAGFAAGLHVDGAGAQFTIAVPPDMQAQADRDQLYRILLNLLRNAAEAVAGAGEVRVAATKAAGRVVVEVSDTGPGLNAAAARHLFEPFRGGAREGGVGLGLAIARDLARAHGGDLALVRTGPLGTTFRFDLPAAT
jgi:signal transduction histidine kinase